MPRPTRARVKDLFSRINKDEELLDSFLEWIEEGSRSREVSGPPPKMGNVLRRAPEHTDKHWLSYDNFGPSHHAYILFMDIVGYSKLKTAKAQKETISLLNSLVRRALKIVRHKLDDVICLPTGDGMCLCFAKEPENSLKVAEIVQRAIWERKRKKETPNLEVRMGIHCGFVVRVNDLKGGFNLAGDAINMTQRAMDCGQQGHILCTSQAYDQFGQMGDQYRRMLRPAGTVTVKHRKRIKLYNYIRKDIKVGNEAPPQSKFGDAGASSKTGARHTARAHSPGRKSTR